MNTPNLSAADLTRTLRVGDAEYHYTSLEALDQAGFAGADQLPFSLRVLLENLARHLGTGGVDEADLRALLNPSDSKAGGHEIAYHPARVLMQDFTGVPAVADLAAMRGAVAAAGGDPERVNPACPVDLVIDHSVMVDRFGSPLAFQENVALEMARNRERYQFLRWGQRAFANFRVVPPGTGICHQVNLEYLGQAVWAAARDGVQWAYPDTLVGTDSHTTMVNGLGVLGWGVGGIEAEAAMLGQPISMLIPEVVGMYLHGEMREGTTATDLVLTVTELLRRHGVVGKFVEFFGPGLDRLPLADRATIANMAPEYGATCGFFPVDQETLNYLELSGRPQSVIDRVEAYTKAQGMWRESAGSDPDYSARLELDLGSVEPSLAGPKRPQDRVALSAIGSAFDAAAAEHTSQAMPISRPQQGDSDAWELEDGDVVIAAITSCTNTSNPAVMLGAGLLAKRAVERGLATRPWVKTSLAPGSKVVTDYLDQAGLTPYLEQLGFHLVGYGCTTCIGNSGPLPVDIEEAVQRGDLWVASVLSGNRNFEGRVHPLVKTNWLASPPLVVAFALAGTVRIDLTEEPLAHTATGEAVYLRDLWPTSAEIAAAMGAVRESQFAKEYAEVFAGDEAWNSIEVAGGTTYTWDPESTYIQEPPFFTTEAFEQPPIQEARILALLGDSITTDHISPAGSIKPDSPAGQYLQSKGVSVADFNSYGSRRGNHEVMMRGTFANVRLRNEMVPGVEGGYTLHHPSREQVSIYDAAMRYGADGVPLVVVAGKEYGTGSSRDWAAKGTLLLGVRAVIAESFERIHRSNLVGMGVLPLEFTGGDSRKTLSLTGEEVIGIDMDLAALKPGQLIEAEVRRPDGTVHTLTLKSRVDTGNELAYYRAGGILNHVLQSMG